MGGDVILDVDGLSVSYPTERGWLRALDDVSLTIGRGEVRGLVGESGSGKSTVILALLGLLGGQANMQARRASFDGLDLMTQAATLRGRRIGMVFQDPSAALNPALTIGLQVMEPMLAHLKLPRAEAFERATGLLAEMGIPRPAQIMRAYPHQLSGGMKQRVVIATALAAEPELLLLDEPTTALDVTIEAQILDLLDELRVRRGLSMLLVSHNLGIVDRICDGLTVLYAGRVAESGRTAEILSRPRHPYTRGLLSALPRPDRAHPGRLVPIPGGLPDLTVLDVGCNFRARCGFSDSACGQAQQLLPIATDWLVSCHRSAEIADAPAILSGEHAARPAPDGAALITADRLSRSFGKSSMLARILGRAAAPVRAVDEMSVSIRPGEILGLVGESGCGKSTFGRLLLRLLQSDAGTLTFDGTEVAPHPDKRFRQRAQIVFQNPDTSLNPRQSVAAILSRPLMHFGIAEGRAVDSEIMRLLETVRLPAAYRDRYPHQLSGGEKQRVGIARALASRPDFLVCDEAVSALDVSVQAAVLNLLRDLRDEMGIAYLFISHDIGVIAHIADRVAVMYRGRTVEEGSVAEVLAPPYHPYTEALLSAVPVVGRRAPRIRLAGDANTAPPSGGCRFVARCPRKVGSICESVAPPVQQVSPGHSIACHIPITELTERPRLFG